MNCYVCGGELNENNSHTVNFYPDVLGPIDLCDECWKIKIE